MGDYLFANSDNSCSNYFGYMASLGNYYFDWNSTSFYYWHYWNSTATYLYFTEVLCRGLHLIFQSPHPIEYPQLHPDQLSHLEINKPVYSLGPNCYLILDSCHFDSKMVVSRANHSSLHNFFSCNFVSIQSSFALQNMVIFFGPHFPLIIEFGYYFYFYTS